jgi:hypothetical protein
MQIVDSRLLWWSGDGIHIWDISSPTSPKEIGMIPDEGYVPPEKLTTGAVPPEIAKKQKQHFSDYAVSGNNVFASSRQSELKIFDISDPANPRRVNSPDLDFYSGVSQILISGNRAYLLGVKLRVIDITGPDNFPLLKLIDMPETWDYRYYVVNDNFCYLFGLYPWGWSERPLVAVVLFVTADISAGVATSTVLHQ